MQNVCIARHTRNKRRNCERIDPAFRKIRDLLEQVMPDLPRAVARHSGRHAVRRDVAAPRNKRAHNHQPAPQTYQANLFQRDQIVNDIRQNPRNRELHKRTDRLKADAHAHTRQKRF